MKIFCRAVTALFVFTFSSLGSSSWAETITLTPDMPVNKLLASAKTGTIYILEPGVYTDPLTISGRKLSLEGKPGAVLRVSGTQPALFLGNGAVVSVRGLKIAGDTGNQPLVWIEKSEFELTNSDVEQASGYALYVIDSSILVKSSAITSKNGSAVFLARGSSAIFQSSKLKSPRGSALTVQNSKKLRIEDSNFFGTPALNLNNLSGKASVKTSIFKGVASDRNAVYFKNVNRIDIQQSVIVGGRIALRGIMTGQTTASITDSLVTSDQAGAVDITGDIASNLDIQNSVILASAKKLDNPSIGNFFEGTDFAPIISDSAIMAPNGIGLAVKAGAGVFAKRTTLFGRRAPIWLKNNSSELTNIADSLVAPAISVQDRSALDVDTARRSTQSREEVLTALDEITTRFAALTTAGELKDVADVTSEVSNSLSILAKISERQLSAADQFASISVFGRDIADRELPVGFSLLMENMTEVLTLPAGETAEGVVPGNYSVNVPSANYTKNISILAKPVNLMFD